MVRKLLRKRLAAIGSLVLLVLLLGLWQIAGSSNPQYASYPTQILRAARQAWSNGTLTASLLASLNGWLVGLAIAVVLGLSIGYLVGMSKWASVIAGPYVIVGFATPRSAMVPLLILWVGVGLELRIVIVILAATFPIIMNLQDGVENVDRTLIMAGESFCASRFQLWRTVIVPGSLPFLLTGLRHGLTLSIIGTIVAELLASNNGIGHSIGEASNHLNTDTVMVYILIIGIVSAAISGFLSLLNKRIEAARG